MAYHLWGDNGPETSVGRESRYMYSSLECLYLSKNSVDLYQLASDDEVSLSGSIRLYLQEELNIEIKF